MKNKKILYGLLGIGAIAGFYFWNKNKNSSIENSVITNTYTESELDDKINKLAKEQYAKIKNNQGAKTETQIIEGLKTLTERVKKNGFTSKNDIDRFFSLVVRMEDKNTPLTTEESLSLDKFIEVKK